MGEEQKKFQNNYWSDKNQESFFRHNTALELIGSSNNILDLGCGDGLLLEKLTKRRRY